MLTAPVSIDCAKLNNFAGFAGAEASGIYLDESFKALAT
jgi:hypothetical protein